MTPCGRMNYQIYHRAVAVQQHFRMRARACYQLCNEPDIRAVEAFVTNGNDWSLSQQGSRSSGRSPGQRWSQGFGLTQWRIDANRLMRGSPSDGGICETMFPHIFSTIDVPQINHHRASHQIP